MEYESMEYESEIAREVKALLLDLMNRTMPRPDYKGGVAFLPGDARIIKRKIIKINNLLADHISLPVWPDVVIPGDKTELRELLSKLTDGQRNRIELRYGPVEKIADKSSISRATCAARRTVEANKRTEEEIFPPHTT